MAKDAKSTFQIIDDQGCPVDPSIFPAFTPDGNSLQAVYEAFRFTESYGVIFQCNVKYCLGPCEPVSLKSDDFFVLLFVRNHKLIYLTLFQAVCDWGRDSLESWGRRKRSVSNLTEESVQSDDEEMNISQEILVLDFGDEKQSADFLRSDQLGGFAAEADFTRGKLNVN